jgi:hypothetical protein
MTVAMARTDKACEANFGQAGRVQLPTNWNFSPRAGFVLCRPLLAAILLVGGSGCAGHVASSNPVSPPDGSAVLSPNATSLNFGPVPLDGTGSTEVLIVTNTGNAEADIQSIVCDSGDFTWAGPTLPIGVPAKQSIQLGIVLQPTSPHTASGTLSIISNASNSPLSISLSGLGIAPSISVAPASLDFGRETVDTASVQQSVTVSNPGQLTLAVGQVSVTPLEFRLSGPAPPLSILPGGSVTYGVSFAPTAAQTFSGSLTITSNAYTGAATTSLSGTGVLASTVLNVTPISLNFDNEIVNTTSPPQNIVLSNGGSGLITISSVQATPPFEVSGFAGPTQLNPAEGLALGVTFTPTALTGYSGALTILSTAPPFSNIVSLSGAAIPAVPAPRCGQPDDGLIHVPLDYLIPLAPPAGVGQTLVDPQYGCTVTKLTTFGEFEAGEASHHNYSTITPFNADDSKVMLLLDDASTLIVDTQGNVVVPIDSMPATNTNDTPWDPHDPAVFYFTNDNQFLKGTISGGAVTTSVLHEFTDYISVEAPDQEDLSDDGCKYWLVGTPSDGGSPVGILYNLCIDTVISQDLVVGVKDSDTGWHKIQIFPSGKMLMTWNSEGPDTGQGTEIYNTDGTLDWHVFDSSAHADVGTDLQGREVLLQSAGEATSLNGCTDPYFSITVIDINLRAPTNCLLDGIPPWHVSYRDSPKGWVLLSMFDNGACPDFSCFVLPLDWASIWPLYGEELLLVKVDGSAAYRLAHHRSRSAENYFAEPRAAISRDGKYILWDSNFAISNTGDQQYSDVYLIQLH